MKPFAWINYRNKTEMYSGLESLLSDLLRIDLVLIVIEKQNRLLFERFRYRSIYWGKGKDYTIYSAILPSQFPEFISFSMKTSPWHQPYMHFLIGKHKLLDLLISKANCHLTVKEIEDKYKAEMWGAMDALDGELICYGRQEFRNVISRQSNAVFEP